MKLRKALLFIGIAAMTGCMVFACIGLVSVGLMANAFNRPIGVGDAVAVIYVEGVILTGRPSSDFSSSADAYSEKIIEYLRDAQRNSSVKAVVLRIDSPGGSVVASREIYDEVMATRKKGKPVVASFAELAASGGYYIAAGADKIYSHPDTTTGSIGVISVLTNLQGLADKLGVQMVVIKSGAHKDESYGFRDLTSEERDIWQKLIDEAYGEFVDIVVQGRQMKIDQVKRLADGRIYSGNQAKALGLVDEIGNLEAAVDTAAKLGNITGTPRKIEYRHTPGFFESIGSSLGQNKATQELLDAFLIRQRGRLMYLYISP